MLKMKILAALLILIINKANCQHIKNDNLKIHQMVIRSLQKEGVDFIVNPSTTKNIFSGFDFKSGARGIDTSSNRIWNKPDWIMFVKEIDTALLEDYSIEKPVEFIKPAKYQLSFAPVIFSKAKDKALCLVKLYAASSGTGQISAWYFENEKGKWINKSSQTFSLIN